MRKPSLIKIFTRVLLILFVGLFLYGICYGILHLVEGEEDDIDTVDLVRWCDDEYYNREYAELYETLNLFDLYGKEYDKYWELVNGYMDYQNYLMWEKAQAAGVENAASYVEDYYSKVKSNVDNCRYPLHKGSLEQFWEDIKK